MGDVLGASNTPSSACGEAPFALQVSERPEGFEHLGGVSRETDPIATGNQFEDNQKHDVDGARMEAHFKLFEYNPLDPAPTGERSDGSNQ